MTVSNYGKVNKTTFFMIFGIILIALSFIHWFLPYKLVNLTLATSLFMLGNILFFDAIVNRFTHTSFIHFTFHSLKIGIKTFVCFFIFIFFIELYAHWLGKFWYFPQMDETFYFFVEIPLLVLYSAYLFETYQGIKTFLIYKLTIKDVINTLVIKNVLLIWIVGLTTFLSGTFFLFWQRKNDTLEDFLSINTIPSIDNAILNLFVLILLCISMWVILELLIFKKTKRFFLLSNTKGGYTSLLTIFIAGISSAFFYEVFNAPGGFWRYGNIPLSEFNLLGIPVLVFLGWPFQYLILIPLYKLMMNKD